MKTIILPTDFSDDSKHAIAYTVNLFGLDYFVTVSDSNGCLSIDSIALDQPDSLIALLTVENVIYQGAEDGSAEVSVSGGSTPYEYNWSNASTSQQANKLSNGIVSVTITDNNGCQSILQDSISFTYPLPHLFIGADITICEGETLVLSVDEEFSEILWSNNSTSQHIEVDESGLYYVEVSDSNGCSNIDSIEVLTEICIGQLELLSSTEATIYPNPSSGSFRLILNQPSNAALKIYNSSGAIVYTRKLSNENDIPISLNVNSVIYFIPLRAEGIYINQSILIR
jgi:hypothetical protein